MESRQILDAIHYLKIDKALKLHKHKIWQGENGKWYTYVDTDSGRKLIKRSSEESIHERILEQFEEEDKPKTFAEAWKLWHSELQGWGLSPNTIKRYGTDYTRFFSGTEFSEKRVNSISREDIELFMIDTVQKMKLSEKPTRALFGYISRTLQWCVRKNMVQINMANSVDSKVFMRLCVQKNPLDDDRIFSEKEMRLLLRQIRIDHRFQPDYIPTYAVEFATCTGMRVGELSGLRWENIRFDDRVLIIDASEKMNEVTRERYVAETKTRKSRVIPITERMLGILRTVQKVQMKNGWHGEFVFQNENGRIRNSTISSCLETKCIQAGIKPKSIHAIRRTVNSQMKSNGVPTVVAAQLLGHSEQVNERCYTYDTGDFWNKLHALNCADGGDYRSDYLGKISSENAENTAIL